MSHESEQMHFLERYWQPLVILYGVLAVTAFCFFRPYW